MNYKFQIGDRVRIRDWDELIEEYGKILDMNMPVLDGVVADMKDQCGREFTIREYYDDGFRNHPEIPAYRLELEYDDQAGYYWDERFFELAEPECEITITTDELRAILNVR